MAVMSAIRIVARAVTRRGLATATALLVVSVSAHAQQADPRLSEERQPAGWSVTPRVTSGFAYDDNVLIQGRGDNLQSDLNTALGPGGSLDYVGKYSVFTADYRGTFQLYRDLGELNTYEQSLNASARRLVSRHLLIFGQQSYSRTPSTDIPLINGVPWVRIGARIESLRGGIEATPSRHLSINASYNFQWISFDNDPVLGLALYGGHSYGGTIAAKYQISPRTALTADYDMERANVVTGSRFNVQNTWAGAEYQLDEASRVFGSFGFAHLDQAELSTAKTSPAWRAGYTRRFKPFSFDVTYSRSFQPSYGGGGTLSNEDVTSAVHVPIGRRWYAQGTFSWRKNEPLLIGELALTPELPLTSLWTGVVAGYAVQPWLHIQGFYDGSHQSIDRPGGVVDRHRVGLQIMTGKPVRIR